MHVVEIKTCQALATHLFLACFLTGLGVMIAQTLEEQIMRWLRAAELTCDRAALLVTQDAKVY